MEGEGKDQERARQRAGADASTETPGNQRPDRLGLEGVLGQENARRGRSQGCDFLSLDFLQRQLCLFWGSCLDLKGACSRHTGPSRAPRLELSRSGLMERTGAS